MNRFLPGRCRRNPKDKEDSDENVVRGNWSGKADYFISTFGFAVGLGNIWRFPYLCYKNGGGAFLIPYLFFLLIIGWPVFFLEVAVGQFSSLSPIPAWRISPFFQGVGGGMVLVVCLVKIYYNTILGWTLYYMAMSCSLVLPWTTCDNPWNTEACTVRNQTNAWLFDDGPSSVNASEWISGYNITNASTPMKRISPSEEFWERNVLQRSSGIDNMGGMRWELFGCFTAAWVATWLCITKGIKSAGKVVYVTAICPVILQFIMLCRGVTLPGAIDGIKYYIIPQWDKLLNLRVWLEAAMQIAYSNGAGWGSTLTFASYNRFHKNCYRESLGISTAGSIFSIFSGFVVFTIIGYVAHEVGSDVKDVVGQGAGLIFIVYPAAMARLPVGQLWSFLFFFMMFMVGLDSMFANVEVITSTIFDFFPHQLRGRARKLMISSAVCILFYLFGLPCVMQGGVYVLTLIDYYTATTIVIVFFTESLVSSWIYGHERFIKDIELMIGYRPAFIWKIMWGVVTPATTAFVFVMSMTSLTHLTYGSYSFPAWSIAIGWSLGMLPFIAFPVYMVKSLAGAKGNIIQRLKEAVQPAPRWGPALPKYRDAYIATLSGSRKDRILRRINDDNNDVVGSDAELVDLDENSVGLMQKGAKCSFPTFE